MSDRWTERLSDYLDGELGAGEREAIGAHLAACPECAATLDELRSVVSRARALDDRLPAEDLWPGIATAIGVARPAEPDVVDLRARRRSGARRFSFSLPELAAAAVALMLVSGGAVWLARSGGEAPSVAVSPGTREAPGVSVASPGGEASPALSALAPASSMPVVNFAEEQYGAAIADLERALAEGQGRLDPATVRVLEENLRIIDRAIEQARRALAADPGSIYLNDHLAENMRRKLELLRRANAIVGAQT